MYLRREQLTALLGDFSTSIRSDYRVLENHLSELLHSDDWGFIVKATGVLESNITDVIVAKTGGEEIRSVVARLPLADTRVGKLRLAGSLGLIDRNRILWVRKLATLRNRLAHESPTGFDLRSFFEGLDVSGRRSWHDATLWFAKDKEARSCWETVFEKHPQAALWTSLWLVVADLRITIADLRCRAQIDRMARETTTEILNNLTLVV